MPRPKPLSAPGRAPDHRDPIRWPYAGFALEPGRNITVPYGVSTFPDPLNPRLPRRFVERSRTDLRFWRDHDRGGHLPMLEQTDALADDIRAFARTLGS